MDIVPHLSSSDVALVSSSDPTANLTFDLHLSTEEKEARSKVVLPYTSQQVEVLDKDDIDDQELDFDSDPDDDLDI